MIEFLKNTIKPIYYSTRNLVYRIRLLVYGLQIREFDDSFYDGKRVIVIGPAESSLTYMNGEDIDKFDIVVRVNKSHLTLHKNLEKLGSKTDVLYHCFHADPIGGCGYIDEKLLRKQNNHVVIYPYHEQSEIFRFYDFIYKFRTVNFSKLNKKYYLDIKKEYPAKYPTTGFQVLNHLIQQNFKELHITGFTFLKTPYISGYRDSHKTPEKIMELVNKGKNHSPDTEFELFCSMYHKYDDKEIHLDRVLETLINEKIEYDKV